MQFSRGPAPHVLMKRGLPVIWSCIALLQTQFLPAASGLCFSDGIPESQRINLTNDDGESYPVGIWVPTWAAAVATSAVMEILVAEKLGFLTVTGGGSSTLDGFFAMAGCETPTEIADRKCGRKKTYYHLHLEGWTDSYRAQWSRLQEDYPDTAVEIVGSMGYHGLSGQYISREKSLRRPMHKRVYPCSSTVLTMFPGQTLQNILTISVPSMQRASNAATKPA